MRVASSAIPDSLVTQLTQLNARQHRLLEQASSGQRVQSAADDPVAMRQALEAQTENRAQAQYQQNIAFLRERTTASLNSLQGLQRVVDRAAELATLADGTRSSAELQAYASEVDQLLRHAVQVANSRHGDAYLFGGTRTDQAPFDLTEDTAGQVTAVTHRGNASVPELEVAPGTTITAQVPGANPTATGPRGALADPRSGADLFAHLIALRDHLLAGDTGAIAATDRAALGRDEDALLHHIAAGGATQARLDAAAATASERSLALQATVSRHTNADLAATLVELSTTQNAYRAALQSGATLLNTSLLDYLR
jgi:flagellar hook-associated protein 3 FlgL